jgi:hypothetical protein
MTMSTARFLAAAGDAGLHALLGHPPRQWIRRDAPVLLREPPPGTMLSVLAILTPAWLATTSLFDTLLSHIPREQGITNGMTEISVAALACLVLAAPERRGTTFLVVGTASTATWWAGTLAMLVLPVPTAVVVAALTVLALARAYACAIAFGRDRDEPAWLPAVLVLLASGLAVPLVRSLLWA